jgi:5,10-methylene-tetrahydrofolate dehydrogenase/methenyl tetrahydrofolate cyclohydrolase
MSKKINISKWVAKSKDNPDKYALRQVTEILINAIGQTKFLKGNMFLKGGTLMALAHESQRMTGDVDFSWLEPFNKDVFRSIDE